MAECRCGICEHCIAAEAPPIAPAAGPHVPPVPSHVPAREPTARDVILRGVQIRKLLTRSQVAAFRSGDFRTGADLSMLLDAYETAIYLLEAVVRAPDPRNVDAELGPSDVAWLALRETEQ